MRSLLVFAVWAVVGCSAESGPVVGDAGTTIVPDAADDAATADLADIGAFQIGTNGVFEATPQNFVPMVDGAEQPFTFGVQGSWMVVLAFRTHDVIAGPFDLVAEISIDGVPSGNIWFEGQETFPGGDGWDYYYNLFLPIDDDDPPAVGTPLQILMRVTDESGAEAEQTHDVLAGPANG